MSEEGRAEEAVREERAGRPEPAPGGRGELVFALVEAALVIVGAGLVAWLGSRVEIFPLESYPQLAKARSLAGGGGFAVPWNDGAVGRFWWGYPLALALPVKYFGEAGFWVLAALLHAGTGVAFARLLRWLAVGREGRVAAVALAMFSPVALWWASMPTAEPLLAASATTAALFAVRWRKGAKGWALLSAAAMAGLALLTQVEGLIVGAAVAAIVWSRVREERRWLLLAGGVVLFLAPAASQFALPAGPSSGGGLAVFDELRGHLATTGPLEGLWRQVRAPYWMIFRFDSEPWLYSRHFPGWLTGAQGFVLVLYLLSGVAALTSGFYKRGRAFACAVGVIGLALLNTLRPGGDERLGYLALPAAALVFALGLEKLLVWARPRLRVGVVLGIAGVCALTAGAYGVRTSQMYAQRLVMEEGGRDFRAIARAANAANRDARPVITDLGPRLAFYLNGHVYFDRAGRGLHGDAVPTGAEGQRFLREKRVRAVVSGRSVADVEAELGLIQGETRSEPAPGATLLVIEEPAVATGS